MKIFCKIPKNTFIVSENQIKQINEAMNDTFSYEELGNIRALSKRVAYCKQHLGNPIGNGSSRMVFQIDDEKVLKLAKNQKGIAQNNVEADWGAQNYGVLPNLYKVADDDSYLVTEYVLPAKPQDFQVCLGMSFEDFCNLCKNTADEKGIINPVGIYYEIERRMQKENQNISNIYIEDEDR